MEERSVMGKVRAVSSGESEFHGLGTGAVTKLLVKYSCRERADEEKILVVYFDSMATHMEHQLGATDNDKVKWLWMRQGMDKIELWNDVMWILTNLMGMN